QAHREPHSHAAGEAGQPMSTASSDRISNEASDARLVLSVRDARKAYGFVTALAGASLELHEREIVALLGDNGGGKSTLIKSISGIVALDSGSIDLDGRPLRLRSPADARASGIETVFQ